MDGVGGGQIGNQDAVLRRSEDVHHGTRGGLLHEASDGGHVDPARVDQSSGSRLLAMGSRTDQSHHRLRGRDLGVMFPAHAGMGTLCGRYYKRFADHAVSVVERMCFRRPAP